MDMVRLGRGIRALRRRRGWTQQHLADEAAVSQSVVARLERGKGDRIQPRVIERIAQALGARLIVRLDWNGEALDRLLDESHAAIVEAVVRELRACGWELAVEVTFSTRGERGSIDVLAWHPPTRTLLAIEVKSVVPDLQATFMAFDRKARLAPVVARDRGWQPLRVGHILVIGEGPTARRRVRTHRATFDAELPDRNVAVRAFLRQPASRQPIRGLWFLSSSRGTTSRFRVRPAASRR